MLPRSSSRTRDALACQHANSTRTLMKKTTQFKQLLQSDRLEFLLEAHNGISARIGEEAGFKGDSTCPNIFSEVQRYCESSKRKDKVSASASPATP